MSLVILAPAKSNTALLASLLSLGYAQSTNFMKFPKLFLLLLLVSPLASSVALGGNPLVTNIFTADPSGRVFNGRLYVYTSHDLPDATYWDMVDWRLLSTTNLATWEDHGSIFRVTDFAWATRWAWAPDCVQANGKYYLFL